MAQDRLAEAHAGSPLLSPDEQARVLHVAQDAVMRLCEAEHQDGALQAPQTPENLSAIKIDGTEKPNLRHFSRMRA